MLDYNRFKKSFYLGRLIWVEAASAPLSVRILDAVLVSCGVSLGQVWDLDAGQFIRVLSRGIHAEILSGKQVIRIRGLDHIDLEQFKKIRKVLDKIRPSLTCYGIRIIFVSESVRGDFFRMIEDKVPMVFAIRTGIDPDDLNLRVHRFLEIASAHAKVRVQRISERAAYFLEESLRSDASEDLMSLVVFGLCRSDGKTLRFRDLVPHFSSYFDRPGSAETA
jgi:hypothetical protein